MLNKKLIVIIYLLFGLASSLIAATQSKVQPTQPTTSTGTHQVGQWEYLVVSYGKTFFGSPEKTLAYRSIGFAATAQEANEIQQSLDVLGRFGWEVITIVGAIGGDQQIVMKRRYDKDRVANEGLEILRGRELYLKDLIDILERGRKIREEAEAAAASELSKPRLIDLDAKESEEKRLQLTSALDTKVRSILSNIQGFSDAKVTTRVVDSSGNYNLIDVKFDLTGSMLKNGNTYRASEVKSWLSTTAIPSFWHPLANLGGDIDITVTAIINFNGKEEKVGQQKTRYSRILHRWD